MEMRTACRLSAEVLDYIETFTQTGVTAFELDPPCAAEANYAAGQRTSAQSAPS